MTKKRKLSNQVSNRTKVLVFADSPTCATGFGTVTRNVCEALYKTGRYSIDILGINYWGDPHSLPYNIWPVGINNDRDPYGRKKVAAMLGQMDYDILFLLQDSFILDFMPQVLPALKQQGKKFRSICYYPIDGTPKEQWIKNVTTADYTFTYSKFGADKSKEAYPGCGNIGTVPHGANFTDFKKLPDDQIKQFKHAFFGANKDKFIVTNVNRNQHRKDIPRTIAAFKEFRKEVPNSILYLHMAAKDQGWNLDEVVKAYGFNTKDDVLFPDKFGPNQGYPIEVVNMIYNASDLLVSTTLGEGWGLAWIEAMATKTPVLMPSNTVFPELITEDRGYLCKSGTTPELTTVLPHDNEVIRPLVDTTDMANKMIHIYNNYDEALAKAENAYKWVSSELDWQGNVGKMWVDIFDKATLDLLTAGTAQESDISGGVIQAESF